MATIVGEKTKCLLLTLLPDYKFIRDIELAWKSPNICNLIKQGLKVSWQLSIKASGDVAAPH